MDRQMTAVDKQAYLKDVKDKIVDAKVIAVPYIGSTTSPGADAVSPIAGRSTTRMPMVNGSL